VVSYTEFLTLKEEFKPDSEGGLWTWFLIHL
jgi:hypothetical protein